MKRYQLLSTIPFQFSGNTACIWVQAEGKKWNIYFGSCRTSSPSFTRICYHSAFVLEVMAPRAENAKMWAFARQRTNARNAIKDQP